MKATNLEIWVAQAAPGPGIPSPLAVLSMSPMKPKSARATQKLVRRVEEAAKDIDAVRLKLCQEHADKDEQGEPKQMPETGYVIVQNAEAFKKDWQELLDETIELDCRPIRDDELIGSALLPADFERLGPFLVESE